MAGRGVVLVVAAGALVLGLAGCGGGSSAAGGHDYVTPVGNPVVVSSTAASPSAASGTSSAPASTATAGSATAGTPATSSAAPASSSQPAPEPAPCGPEVAACVRLSTKQAWLEDHGRTTFGPVRIMYGAPGLDTPTGTFHVIWKAAELISNIYGTPMPHSVFFAPGGIAFHEGSLTEFSHGCVHLSAGDATTFFNALDPGAVVQVLP